MTKTAIIACLFFILMATATPAFAEVNAKATTAQVGKVYPKGYWDAFDEEFSEGLAAVEKNSKAGFVDKSWRLVIQPVYDFVFPFNGGQALAKKTANGSSLTGAGNAWPTFLTGRL